MTEDAQRDPLADEETPAEETAATGGPVETLGAAEEERTRRGFYLTPRQAFTWIAVILGIVLVLLIIYLIWLLQPKGLGRQGGGVREGIEPILTIEGPGGGKHPTFQRPLGATYDPKGRIWVSDTGNNRVCVFEGDGRFLFEFGEFGVDKPAPGGKFSWKEGRLNFPAGIAADEQGNIYVADFRNDQIQVFDPAGKFLRRFPDNKKKVGKGSSGQDGAGIAVTALAVRDGKVYATDTYQVFVFTTTGKLLQQFGKPGREAADLDHPNGVAAAKDGTIYVSDSNHARVTAFDPKGKPLWNAGRIPASMNDTSPGTFDLPRGLDVLDDGSLIVVDAFGFDLVKLSPSGQPLGTFGVRGVQPGEFNFPNDVSHIGDRLLVADKENNRVQVLRLVKR